MLKAFADGPFIFNLGHGILPETPIAHVERMLKRVAGAQAERLRRACAKWPRGARRGDLVSRPGWQRRRMYLWVKALHVMAVIAWMAGMLYLPRLFVYHADARAGSEQSETFKVMERRLLRGIITPAMIVTWLSARAGAAGPVGSARWLHAKLVAGPVA